MPLNNVDLYRIDGTLGSVSNIQTAAINNGPIAGSRNRIINGDMRIDQRNNGALVTLTAQGYVLDRWYQSMPSSSKYSVIRSTTAPAGFTNSLRIASLSSYTVQSNETFYLGQRIEGYNVDDLSWGTASAKTVTLSFWVYSSLTGTFGGALTSFPAGNRAYPFTYAVPSANTWTYVTVTVPGDTTGTWATDNGQSISVAFSIGSGSSYSAAAGSWATGQFTSATGSTSILGTNGATLFITGVQLEPGTIATPFERRSYGQELTLCQRYYEHSSGSTESNWKVLTWEYTDGVISRARANQTTDFFANYRVEKRVAPTHTWYSATGVAGNAAWENPGVTNLTNLTGLSGTTVTRVLARTRSSSVPDGAFLYANWEATAEL
jgi:hypothetical protein